MRHDAVRQRAVVHTDAQGGAVLTTDGEQLLEALFKALQFGGIFLGRVFQCLELAGWVHIVAWIDAHLLDNCCRYVGHGGIEVDVGHQRYVDALACQLLLDIFQIISLDGTLCRQSHQVCTRLDQALDLLYASCGVRRGTGGHTLQTDGLIATYGTALDLCFVRFSRGIIEKVHLSIV